MSGAALIPSGTSFRGRTAGRLRLALAASAACHLGLAAILVSETPGQGVHGAGAVPIRVRLEPMPLAGSDGPTHQGRVAPLEGRTIERAAAISEVTARQVSPGPPAEATQGTDLPPALPPVPDQTVFSARDLDAFPAPVAPFDVDRVAARVDDDAAGEVRLEVLIDEHGRVKEIAFAGPRTLGASAARLRDIIAATRFVPARKDGRAVKSRVVLSVNLRSKQREP